MSDNQPLPFRRYRAPLADNQFFTFDTTKNEEFARIDLAKSGLTLEDIEGYTGRIALKGAEAGYMIPYFSLTGVPLVDEAGFLKMFRTRLKQPEFSREQKYDSPSGEVLQACGLPSFIPYLHPLSFQLPLVNGEIICAEGEKKTVAILKHLGIAAFGIGGCTLWSNPDGSGTVHPWITKFLNIRGANSIALISDGDIRRYDIGQAYGNFRYALEKAGFKVRLRNPGGKIDDLLVEWGANTREYWDKIPDINPEDLIQTPSSLYKEYGLAAKVDAKGRHVVCQHHANINIVMERHPAIPLIWLDRDINRIMIGEKDEAKEAIPDVTEMSLAVYLQYNLGFDKITPKIVRDCMRFLAKKNERSPFLDWVRAQIWDGQSRLPTWLTRLWGVADSPYAREVATKFLVSSCARMDEPGTKIDWMFIVIGPQSIGKSTMPSKLFKGSTARIYGSHSDKDSQLMLHSSLCPVLDELDIFSKKQSKDLKSLITDPEDLIRPPYGSGHLYYKRRFVLYGCGNRHDFLEHDPSGYRRFAIVEATKKLDFDGLEAELGQLWAEAWQVYRNGGIKFWEIDNVNEVAKDFVAESPLVEDIEQFLARKQVDKTGGKVGAVYFSMKELRFFLGLEKEYSNSARIKEVREILSSLGAVRPKYSFHHPDHGGKDKWWIYDPSARAPI